MATFIQGTGQVYAPTPDTPVEMQSVTGLQNINVCGKNLFDIDTTTKIIGGTKTNNIITSSSYSSGSWVGMTISFSPISITEEFTISMDLRLTSGSTGTFNKINDGFTNFTEISKPTISENWQRYVYKYTPSSGYSINKFYIQMLSINGQYECRNIQLEQGSTATEYEEYKSNTYEVNLGNIELNKIGDYQDRIYKDNGKWYVEKNIGKDILNGSDNENWTMYSLTFMLEHSHRQNICFSDKFISTNNVNWTSSDVSYRGKVSTYNDTTKIKFMPTDESITTVALWKTWLASNNVEVLYIMRTPTYTEITNTELINQLESIELLKGTNNISITSENLPALLQLSYYKQTLQGNIEYLDKTKANKEDIPSLDNYYNKTETDTLLDDKADVSDIPDLTNYVKNTDYASDSTVGVIKSDWASGSYIAENGKIKSRNADYATYNSYEDTSFISKGTLENVITGKGLIDNSVNNLTNYTKTSDLSSVATSGSYNDLSDKPTIPTIPTNVSTFTNDAGYITNSVNNLTNYTTTTDMNTALGNKQNTILSGTSDPDSSLGEDGDIYIQYES